MGLREAAVSAPAVWLARGIAAALVLGSLVGCERAKTRMDREVDRLCAIDGGVHIYETVTLPKDDFGKDGEVFPQYRGLLPSEGRYGPDFTGRLTVEEVVPGLPGVARIRAVVIRKADGKVMGEVINYKRSGGDFPGPWEPSHHSCPIEQATVNFERQVFVSQESTR